MLIVYWIIECCLIDDQNMVDVDLALYLISGVFTRAELTFTSSKQLQATSLVVVEPLNCDSDLIMAKEQNVHATIFDCVRSFFCSCEVIVPSITCESVTRFPFLSLYYSFFYKIFECRAFAYPLYYPILSCFLFLHPRRRVCFLSFSS